LYKYLQHISDKLNPPVGSTTEFPQAQLKPRVFPDLSHYPALHIMQQQIPQMVNINLS
jgi:hypothetical protein